MASAGTTGGQYALTVGRGHTFAKAVAISAFGVRWLVSALRHVCEFSGCKNNKELSKFHTSGKKTTRRLIILGPILSQRDSNGLSKYLSGFSSGLIHNYI